MKRFPWLAFLLPLLLLALVPFTRAATPRQPPPTNVGAYLPLVYQDATVGVAETPTASPTATATRTATATSTATSTATATATSTTAPAPPVINGGFEDAGGWATSGQAAIVQEVGGAHGGAGFAQLGGNQGDSAAISQTLTVPADYPLLYFYHARQSAQASCTQDVGTVRVDGQVVATLRNFCAAQPGGYEVALVDLSAYVGQTVTLSFALAYTPATATFWRIDDVSFQ